MAGLHLLIGLLSAVAPAARPVLGVIQRGSPFIAFVLFGVILRWLRAHGLFPHLTARP